MEEQRRCIFHIPNWISPDANSGSGIRPRKMIRAFQENGYLVDCVMGYGRERKTQIEQIKKKITAGVKYDFLYAENSTSPTLLTEKSHFPFYPFLDFNFFLFCKKNGIKIGLFYRDIYWKFPIYKREVPLWQRCLTIPMFKYDLKKYEKLVDKLYLPSQKMQPYLPIKVDFSELPPGCEENINMTVDKMNYCKQERKALNLFYVGGVGELYDLTKLFQAISQLEFVRLVVCCRKEEWESNKIRYAPFLNERIEIIHKSGKELENYYAEADISMLFFDSEGYRKFAMPIKLFEYLSHLTPIVATAGSAAGEFVEQNNLGWSVDYHSEALKTLLLQIVQKRDVLEELKAGLGNVLLKNTWKARAKRVSEDLKQYTNFMGES